jgi:isochorismate hydrolase
MRTKGVYNSSHAPDGPGQQQESEMNELKANVEALAKQESQTPIQIISMLQAGAAKNGNDGLLDQLCELKWDYL